MTNEFKPKKNNKGKKKEVCDMFLRVQEIA